MGLEFYVWLKRETKTRLVVLTVTTVEGRTRYPSRTTIGFFGDASDNSGAAGGLN